MREVASAADVAHELVVAPDESHLRREGVDGDFRSGVSITPTEQHRSVSVTGAKAAPLCAEWGGRKEFVRSFSTRRARTTAGPPLDRKDTLGADRSQIVAACANETPLGRVTPHPSANGSSRGIRGRSDTYRRAGGSAGITRWSRRDPGVDSTVDSRHEGACRGQCVAPVNLGCGVTFISQ